MIPKRLADISESDLLAPITEGVAEGRSIDYKRELPGNSDGDKKEFLADASSFSNTVGESPPFCGLAVRHKDHAVLPIQVLDTHPEEFSFVPHSCVAHQDDDVAKKFTSSRAPVCKPKLRSPVFFPLHRQDEGVVHALLSF